MRTNYDVEEWKDIKGYEGLYQISSHGRIRSTARKGSLGGIIRPSTSTSGYPITHLSKNGKPKTLQIHRLVATHFIDNPDNLPEVNHLDECKTNNHVSNLEFCTRKQNQNYGTAIARAVASHDYKASAIKSARNHDYKEVGRKQAKPVLQYGKCGKLIKRWESIREAGRTLGVSYGNISEACRGRYKTMYGFIWKYEAG